MTAPAKGQFYSGTSNIELPVRNKLAFPPEYQEKSRLAYYASLFSSVEINNTFYKLPLPKTVAKWAADVPNGFRFTFKLWQEVTHLKGQRFNTEHVARFMHIINQAGSQRGCLLVQFPPSVVLNPVLLHELLSEISLGSVDEPWQVAVEFRHRSWYQDAIYELLDQHEACMVLHDLPASAAPVQVGEANFMYLRFHGPNGGYRGSYEDEFLSEYASYVKEWMQDGKTVYAYFNNTMGGAVQNLMTFNKYVLAED
ncbi:DUF72 domain-containing protein [Mucilaginibacter terrae]|uniref:DUF72 domain-containing protein n=1 Tax=Mucilaginibacter terrae TaxID=1955052 RepID=UPI00363238A7